jgi:hypothetical protein
MGEQIDEPSRRSGALDAGDLGAVAGAGAETANAPSCTRLLDEIGGLS